MRKLNLIRCLFVECRMYNFSVCIFHKCEFALSCKFSKVYQLTECRENAILNMLMRNLKKRFFSLTLLALSLLLKSGTKQIHSVIFFQLLCSHPQIWKIISQSCGDKVYRSVSTQQNVNWKRDYYVFLAFECNAPFGCHMVLKWWQK